MLTPREKEDIMAVIVFLGEDDGRGYRNIKRIKIPQTPGPQLDRGGTNIGIMLQSSTTTITEISTTDHGPK
jgi:hypothetical protein